jgi:hypothetical protein
LPKFLNENAGVLTMLTASIIALTVAEYGEIAVKKIQLFWNDKIVSSFKKLWITISENPWGALATAVAIAVGFIIDYYRKLSSITEMQKALNNVAKKSEEQYAEQEAKIQSLLTILRDEHVALNKRKEALTEIQKIIPNYHASLTEEGKLINDNKNAIKDYLVQLERETKFKAVREELEAQYRAKRLEENKLADYNSRLKNLPANAPQRVGVKMEASLEKSKIDEINSVIQKLSNEIAAPIGENNTGGDGNNNDNANGGGSLDQKKLTALKKYYSERLKIILQNEENLEKADKKTLGDDAVFSKRLQDFKSEVEKEKDIYDQEARSKVITEEEAAGKKKEADIKYLQFVKAQSLARLEVLKNSIEYELEMERLKNEELLAGKKQTNKELHELELKRIEEDRKAQVDQLEAKKKLFPEEETEINKQIALVNQKARTATAKEDAKFNDEEIARKEEAEQNAIDIQLSLVSKLTKDESNLQQKALKLQMKKELENVNLTKEERQLIEQKYALKQAQIDQDASNARIQLYGELFGNISALFKKNTMAYKVSAIAQATIDTYLAANKSLAEFGLPFGLIPMAAAIATGLANVAEISGIGLESGGYVDVTRMQDGKIFKATKSDSRGLMTGGPKLLVNENGEEFVGNADSVKNPTIRNVYSLIDYAQKNNRVSSITPSVIANVVGIQAEGRVSGGFVGTSTTSTKTPGYVADSTAINKMADAAADLSKTIKGGIKATAYYKGKGSVSEMADLMNKMENNVSF